LRLNPAPNAWFSYVIGISHEKGRYSVHPGHHE
jgi:hypothetical protein